MSRKRVLLDCDGVLADFIGRVCDVLFNVCGVERTPDQVTEFDFVKSLGLTADTARRVKAFISDTPGFWSTLSVFPEAIEGVARLREVADVYVVTSPWNSCRTWLHERESWLKKHFDIPHSHVLAGSAKHLVNGDLFVDDRTDALVKWQNEREIPPFAVQWQTPHNRLDVWSGRSTRSWSELLEWAR